MNILIVILIHKYLLIRAVREVSLIKFPKLYFIPSVYSNSQDSWYHSCWVFLFGEKLIYAAKDMPFDL